MDTNRNDNSSPIQIRLAHSFSEGKDWVEESNFTRLNSANCVPCIVVAIFRFNLVCVLDTSGISNNPARVRQLHATLWFEKRCWRKAHRNALLGTQRRLVEMDITRTSSSSSTSSQSKHSDVGFAGLWEIASVTEWLLRLLLVSFIPSFMEESYGQKIGTIVFKLMPRALVLYATLSLIITPKTHYRGGSKSKVREKQWTTNSKPGLMM